MYSLVVAESETHAELPCAGLHTLSDHESVAGLEHVQGAGHVGVGQSTHEDGHLHLVRVHPERAGKETVS